MLLKQLLLHVTNPGCSLNPVAVNVECATDIPVVNIEDVLMKDNCVGTITVVTFP
jgi:hypothetical protein